MHITWLGQTAIKIQTKNIDEEIVTVMDAYRPKQGDFPRSIGANLALFSKGGDGAATLTGDPFTIETLGEFDTKGILITSVAGPEGTTLFKLSAEGMNVVHLGVLHQKLTDEMAEAIGRVDVLIVPVGGDRYLSPADAAQTVTALEPRIVIPVAHTCDTDPKAGSVEAFIKELGVKPEATDKKLILKAKDLPAEETKLYVLEKAA